MVKPSREYRNEKLYILIKDLDSHDCDEGEQGLISFSIKSKHVKIDIYVDMVLLCSFDTDIRFARQQWRMWRYAGWSRSR